MTHGVSNNQSSYTVSGEKSRAVSNYTCSHSTFNHHVCSRRSCNETQLRVPIECKQDYTTTASVYLIFFTVFTSQLCAFAGVLKVAKLTRLLFFFFSDHCVWWASHRLQKPDWSEQSHQSGKKPCCFLSFQRWSNLSVHEGIIFCSVPRRSTQWSAHEGSQQTEGSHPEMSHMTPNSATFKPLH